jgi:hypothetical protein
LFLVALGLVCFVAQLVSHHPGAGVFDLALFVAVGAIFLFGGRSETIRGIRGDGADERFRAIDLQATALAGGLVIVAVVVAFIVQIARGHNGDPYTWLAALGGATYVAAYLVLRARG